MMVNSNSKVLDDLRCLFVLTSPSRQQRKVHIFSNKNHANMVGFFRWSNKASTEKKHPSNRNRKPK